jgi:two-component SAPR family response regulator
VADWGRSANARDLLFFLLEHSPSRKEEIGAHFWPDLSTGRMTSSFHAAKYRVRRALSTDWVRYDNDRYSIDPSLTMAYDVAEFRRLASNAVCLSSGPDRNEALRQALRLYAGDYLAGHAAEWTVSIRMALQIEYFDLLRLLVSELVGQQEWEEALEWCQRGLQIDYYREDLHRAAMRCLMALDRTTEALAHYETAARRLLDELGTPPEADTTDLARKIRSSR